MIRRALKIAFGLLFIAAGVNHFWNSRFYVRIMPPRLPAPLTLVYVSGVCEIGLGALLFTRLRRLAAWGLIALLIAVFPANIQMALHPDQYREFSPALLWGRLPLQGVLLAWAYRYTHAAD